MLFDKLKKKMEPKSQLKVKVSLEFKSPSKAEIKERKKEQEAKTTTNSPFNVVVLWWISLKKNGYEVSSNKFPQWFVNRYSIDFNGVLRLYLKEGLLDEKKG